MRLIAEIQGNIAMLMHARNKLKKARSMYELAYKGGCKQANVLAAFGLLLIREGDFDRAKEVILRGSANAKNARLKMHTSLNLGLALWKLGELDEAIEIYEKALADHATGTIYGTLGFLYIARGDLQGDFEQAIAFNEKAVAYDSDDAILLDNLGQSYLRIGQYEKAQEFFAKALERKPNQFDSLVCMAKCLMESGDLVKANALLAQASARPFSHLNTVEISVMHGLQEQIATLTQHSKDPILENK